jgi:ATP-binding cassette subfamily F protein uup
MSREIILQLKDLCLTRGAVPIFSGVDLSLVARERMALVGPNGVGKSTLLQVISGQLEFDKGERVLAGGATIAVQEQEPDFGDGTDLVSWVMSGIRDNNTETDGTKRARALANLDSFGLSADKNLNTLSGGEIRRAALARAFAAQADLMLLDEPTNHLDIAAIEDLESKLRAFKGAILVISHDRKFLENISTSCLWLRNGKAKKLASSFVKFDEWAQGIEAQEQKAFQKLDLQLQDENRWLARGVTARRTRNQGRLRRLFEMREQRVQILAAMRGAAANVTASTGEMSSKLVVEAKGVCKSFDKRGALIENLDLRILRGDRIGIVGPNGIGKSTLVKMLVGELAPDSGNIRRAKSQTLAYLDQTRVNLDPKSTLWELFAPLGGDQIMVQGIPRHVVGYGKEFLFTPAQMRQPLGTFSGGERNRVSLAIALAKACNLLVLDEPTNDLDMDTLDVLEDVLAKFEGTIILVSHDRAFLDNVVTSTLAPMGNGKWIETPGGWRDLESQGLHLISPKQNKTATFKNVAKVENVPKAPTRLSYKDSYRLEEITKNIPKLENKIAMLSEKLSDASLYMEDIKKFDQLSKELENAKLELEQIEDEWLGLEEKKSNLNTG